VPGRKFARRDGSILAMVLLGNGGGGLVLVLASIAACVMGAPCCGGARRRAAAIARHAAATSMGTKLVRAMTRHPHVIHARVDGEGGGNVGDGVVGDIDQSRQKLTSVQQQRIAST